MRKSVSKNLLIGLVLTLLALLAGRVEATENPFQFPGKGETGWYTNNFGYNTIIYHDRDDRFVQVVSWHNNCQDAVTRCVFRGWGEFLADGSLLIHLFYRGSTISPDETSGIGDFRIFPNGTTSSSCCGSFPTSLLFFGTSPQDGAYFSQQWGCTPPGDGGNIPDVFCEMRLLDRSVGPWHTDWDVQIFSISDMQWDTYLIVFGIGEGVVGKEYSWAHRFPDGIHRPLDPQCPFELFDNSPGCFSITAILPYGAQWWLGSTDLGSTVSYINGRSVRATSRDPRILEEYKKRGPICYEPTLPGCFPE